jgi:hypothetical protein
MDLTSAKAHADAIITAAKAEIDALDSPNGFVADRPAQNVIDRIKAAVDAAAALEDWSS